jgi:hypothetical protein
LDIATGRTDDFNLILPEKFSEGALTDFHRAEVFPLEFDDDLSPCLGYYINASG